MFNMGSEVALVQISSPASTTSSASIDGRRSELSEKTTWCGNRRLMLFLGYFDKWKGAIKRHGRHKADHVHDLYRA